jgi:hypothetical protein
MSDSSFGPYPFAPIQITVQMSPEAAWEFLQQLAHDAEYRQQVEADPQAKLLAIGISVSDGAFPDWARLPTEDELQQLIEIIAPEYGATARAGAVSLKPSPTPPSFGTCLWIAVGLAAAAQSTQNEPTEAQ